MTTFNIEETKGITMPNGLQYTDRHDFGLQVKKDLGKGVTGMYEVFDKSLVGRRVLVKEDSSLASVVQDGSKAVVPFLAIRKDHQPNLVTVLRLHETVIVGEVQY